MLVVLKNSLLVSSSFGNGYITYLEAEIKDYVFGRRSVSKQELVSVLCQRGYRSREVEEEVDRQCYSSTLRYIPLEDGYRSIHLGRQVWSDILNRFHEQPSVVAGKLQSTDSGVKLDIYRSDFQSSEFKEVIKHQGLHQAPVMRWTKQGTREDVIMCIGLLMGILPPTVCIIPADLPLILKTIDKINKKKSKKTAWIWLISHAELRLELTPSRKAVLNALFSLSKGPVDWRGRLVFRDELQSHVSLSREMIEEAIEYLKQQGIVRELKGGLTPTGQGYSMIRHVLTPHPVITFAIVRVNRKKYRLEIGTRSQDSDIQKFLRTCGGTSAAFTSLITLSPCEKPEIITIMDVLLGSCFL
jgi:hypothetical protein